MADSLPADQQAPSASSLERTNPPWLTIPEIRIHPTALADLRGYVEESPTEVSGLALTTLVEPGCGINIVKFYVLRQRCTYVSTVITPDAVAEFLDELLASGGDPANLHVYWHSHIDGNTHPSSVDVNTLGEAFPQAEWMIGLVVNRRGEFSAQLWCRAALNALGGSADWPNAAVSEARRAEVRQELGSKLEVGYSLPTPGGPVLAWGPPHLAWRWAEGHA